MLQKKPGAVAVAAVVGLVSAGPVQADELPSAGAWTKVQSVEFIGMDAPATPAERASTYTEAQVVVTYRNGKSQTFPLSYNVLHYNATTIDGVTVGALYDVNGETLKDVNGKPHISESPDANSLIEVSRWDNYRHDRDDYDDGGYGDRNHKRLFLVTHYEYDWLDTAGNDQYGKQPMTMNLAKIKQNEKTGELTTVALKNIDMSGVGGLWIPCAGSLSPWNTHLGSEEYEPDARCAEKPDIICPSTNSDPAKQLTFNDPKFSLNLDSMNRYLEPSGKTANVYDYGRVPEVTIDRKGNASVVKHRALGRISREIVQVMPDNRTAYQGDDGTYNVLTMFIADQPKDLSAGTLYAAKWNQTSNPKAPGGEAKLTWYRLGHATDAELQAMVDGGITFSKIFDVKADDKGVAPSKTECEKDKDGYRLIKAGHNTGLVECLKLNEKMEQAAAFLETRRYAAYMGATTEFEKFEGVTLNVKDNKVYLAMTRMRDGMEDKPDEPANHIRIPKLLAGAVYEMDLAGNQKDTDDNPIDSAYVGTAMRGLVLGEDTAKDAVGNTAAVDKIANPDNIKYSEKMRTLFIGEDSSTAHINNFLWAYNVDTKQLSRILSIPAGAESTGLQVLDDLNGHAYIMSNYQHAGDYSSNIDPALKTELDKLIDKTKAAIGYLGGLPGLK
jgi:secreted PhoX family phosphatase